MISVILPVFNTARYLEGVIASLRSQDYPADRFELIFVDNGSTDNSLEILRSTGGLTVLTEPARGSYAARNRGIAHANGDILAFTDSDCYPAPDWLAAIEAAFAEHPDAEVLLGPRLAMGPGALISMVAEYENRKAKYVCDSPDPTVYYGYTNNMAVRRSTMDQLGPFLTLDRGSDTVFVRQVAELRSCKAVRYCPQMQVRHGEMVSVSGYYKKMMTYRRNRETSRDIMPVRSLGSSERWRIYRQMSSLGGVMYSLRLLFVLSLGGFAWWLAGISSRQPAR